MINVKPQVFKALKIEFTNVNDGYPSKWDSFPIISYIEEENKITVKTDDKEQIAYIRYKIDIWNNRSTSDLAVKVDEVMTELGFNRCGCVDAPDPSKLKHKVMRFEGNIDINTFMVYK